MEERLIFLLLEISGMDHRGTRDLLLRNFPRNPRLLIERHDAPRQDLSSIVSSAIQFRQIANTGRFAIEILIENAISLVRGLAQENQFRALLQDFQDVNQPVQMEITIPFVIVSMTLDEAQRLQGSLDSINQVLGEHELAEFRRLTEFLQAHSVPDFTQYYDSRREDWRPYSCTNSDQSIKFIVHAIINELNDHPLFQGNNIPIIRPEFVSADFFESDEERRADIWSRLGQRGCVIIIDAVSLFHPYIRRTLSSAQMIANEKISILALSPINPCVVDANQILENLVRSEIELAFHRFHRNLDKRCEIGLGDLRSMKRWFFSTLPEAVEILRKPKPQQENRRLVRESIGSRNGYDELWTGGNQ